MFRVFRVGLGEGGLFFVFAFFFGRLVVWFVGGNISGFSFRVLERVVFSFL